MFPEFGLITLICASVFALLQAFNLKLAQFKLSLTALSFGQLIFTLISFLILVISFINNDFTVEYVAANSNTSLPLVYKISATWGGHEGSLLLWILLLSSWSAVAIYKNKSLPEKLTQYISTVLGFISLGFYCFILFTSNPFARILPNAPIDGADLNPLLQDIGLIVHPPILYMGYVGFAIVFALAIAVLLNGRLDRAWLNWAKPWVLVAYAFLTLGITLGSWWAYYELGWGGWWFWDPVENASLMPWLSATALIHAMLACERRGVFKKWTVLLAILTFALSLFGTFLVRSGVLTSVHAFANDPTRGFYILFYMTLCVGSALVIYASRAKNLEDDNEYKITSRESFILLSNIFVTSICATVILGTIYPLILDALNLGKISVGPPYFNMVIIPLSFFAFVLMGAVQVTRWQTTLTQAFNQLAVPVVLSIMLGVGVPFVFSHHKPISQALGIALGSWLIFTTLLSVFNKIKNQITKTSITRSFLGMTSAHIGMALVVLGISITSHYSVEDDVRMTVGDKHLVGGYEIFFNSLNGTDSSNYKGVKADFRIYKNQKLIATLYPEKRVYSVSKMPLSETAINANLFRDIYIAMGEPLSENTWSVRIYYKPFVRWIWLGGLFIVFGSLISAFDRRYKFRYQRMLSDV